jgi:hypothetical protein
MQRIWLEEWLMHWLIVQSSPSQCVGHVYKVPEGGNVTYYLSEQVKEWEEK